MWADFFKRWLDLCCWWLPKTKGEEESAAGTDRTHTVAENASTDLKASEREAGEDPRSAVADDLTVIKGIGSGTQVKLSRFGIETLSDLAASDPRNCTHSSAPPCRSQRQGLSAGSRRRRIEPPAELKMRRE